MGDVAIFVSFDSADVWTHPDIFRLDANLNPEVVAGVPPDAFSATGQRWGNPLYRWDVLKSRGYDWWVQRMGWTLKNCDLVRIDHFRGFEAYWEIPANEPTAVNGHWVKGPADDLFKVLRERLGGLPLIAEDLGVITPEVEALRDRLEIPGHEGDAVRIRRSRCAHLSSPQIRTEHRRLHGHARQRHHAWLVATLPAKPSVVPRVLTSASKTTAFNGP